LIVWALFSASTTWSVKFCEGPIVRYLARAKRPAVIACPIRGKVGGARALCRGQKGYCTDYAFTDGSPARVVMLSSRMPDEAGRRRVKWLAFVVIHLDWAVRTVRRS
jgi:hypothetical protein